MGAREGRRGGSTRHAPAWARRFRDSQSRLSVSDQGATLFVVRANALALNGLARCVGAALVVLDGRRADQNAVLVPRLVVQQALRLGRDTLQACQTTTEKISNACELSWSHLTEGTSLGQAVEPEAHGGEQTSPVIPVIPTVFSSEAQPEKGSP